MSAQVSVGNGPIYIPERKLGKGGFGQVWLGRRLVQRKRAGADSSTVLEGAHATEVRAPLRIAWAHGCSSSRTTRAQHSTSRALLSSHACSHFPTLPRWP